MEEEENPDTGDLVLEWPRPVLAEHRAYHDAYSRAGTFEAAVALFNAALKLPHDITISHEECDQANAFYDGRSRAIIMCYELLARIGSLFTRYSISDEEYTQVVNDAWLFIFFHELGHGLIDAYNLPVTGREEDAVDDMATLLWIDLGAPDSALAAAFMWYGLDDQEYDFTEFADEHSMHGQRFFAIMCLVYGSSPADHDWIVDQGHLPPDRARRCPDEYEKKDDAWTVLFAPWEQEAVELADLRPIVPPRSLPRPAAPPPPEPVTTYLADNRLIAIPAKSIHHHPIMVEGRAMVQYAFAVEDTSTLDVGIMRDRDVARYERGERVEIWAHHAGSQQANDGVELSDGHYALVLFCRNSMFDCDLRYSLATTS